MKNYKWGLIHRINDDIELKADLITMYQDGDTVTSSGVVLINEKKVRDIFIDHPAWWVFPEKTRKKKKAPRELTYALAHKLYSFHHGKNKGVGFVDRLVAKYFGLEGTRSVTRARQNYQERVPKDIIELFIDGRDRNSSSVFIVILEPDKFDLEKLGDDSFSYDGRFMLWKDDMPPKQSILIESGKIARFS